MKDTVAVEGAAQQNAGGQQAPFHRTWNVASTGTCELVETSALARSIDG